MSAPQLPQLMHPDEVAIRYGITPATLSIWRRKGKGPKFIRVNQRTVWYRAEDLLEWEKHAGK